ncbi:hypothetical protein HPA02_02940 [Bisbaumannia pacifica]|uniref:Uncharacterized protein n=1 Tax=Bisbaumannia pacifica TaxID=77098 RepID=A0A510X4W6_9GAMM|nr:hypothetical protein HPA02_02940 [Halomonas pacifica]
MQTEALKKARQAMADKRAAGEIARLDPIEKASQNPRSLRLAITAKCWECMGGGEESGTRRMIRECTSAGCPLHAQRPYQRNKIGDAS